MQIQPPAKQPIVEGAERLRRKAAAIAVAVVLAIQQTRRPLFQPDLTQDNAWRTINRRRRLAIVLKRGR
jgi:hypothetical protein